MKRTGRLMVAMMAGAVLVVSPAWAAKHASKPAVSCKQIKDAMATGKTADEVAKDMNVSASRVKSCTTPSSGKHHKGSTKKAS